MLLVAGMSDGDAEEAKVLATRNIDAGLVLNQSVDVATVARAVEVMNDIPLGVLLGEMNQDKVAELADAGCDFVVFSTKMPITVLEGKGVGKFLIVEASENQNLLRAVNDLGIDGVVISAIGESAITLEQLLAYQNVIAVVRKPVVMSLPSLVTNAEIASLWKAGVDSIVLPPGQPAEVFAELQRGIENLPRRARRPRVEAAVLIPQPGGVTVEDEEEDGDGEEEEI